MTAKPAPPNDIPDALFDRVEAARRSEEKSWMKRLTILALSVPFGLPILVMAWVFLPKLLGAALVAQLAVLAPWAKKALWFVAGAMKKGGKASVALVAVVIAIVSVPRRRFTRLFSETLLPVLAGARGLAVSRSASDLSRARDAATRTLPFEGVSILQIESQVTLRNESGATDLIATNIKAYRRSWHRRQPDLLFWGIVAVVPPQTPFVSNAVAAYAASEREWRNLRFPYPETTSDGLPEGWKLFLPGHGRVDVEGLPALRRVAGICSARYRERITAVSVAGGSIVVLLDVRDRLFDCLRPERIGGTRSMIDIMEYDLASLRMIVEAAEHPAPTGTSEAPA